MKLSWHESEKRLQQIRDMPSKTKEDLLIKIEACIYCEQNEAMNTEAEHEIADQALLEFINDPKITEAFNRLNKWYS